MGVSVVTTRVACNTSTGTQDITISGFGTPKAARFTLVRAATDGTAADHAVISYGFTDGTRQFAISFEDENALATTETYQAKSSALVVRIGNGGADGTLEGSAEFSAWITDGVRINWTDAPDAAYLLIVDLFGGTDLSVYAGEQDLGTGTSAIDITAIGFEPDDVICALAPAANGAQIEISFGLIHNDRAGAVTQRSISYKWRSGVATVSNLSYLHEDACLALEGNLAETANLNAGSFDSSGFSITPSASFTNREFFYLALRYGTSPVVASKVYTYTLPTGTGANTDSTPGFTPQWVTYLSSVMQAAGSYLSDATTGSYGISSIDATRQYHSTVASEDGAADSNTQSLSDNQAIYQPNYQGTIIAAASLTSLGSTGPVFNYSTAPSPAIKFLALAIEEFVSGTQYPQSVAGTLTSSGTTVQRTGKPVSGALTSSGALINSTRKVLDGALSSAGALINSTRKALTGDLTSSGVVATSKIMLMAVGGTLTSAGTVVLRTAKSLAGTLTSAGIVAMRTGKIVSGALAPDGSLARQARKILDGALTSAGTLILQTGKVVNGILSSTGDLATEYIAGGGELFFQVVEGTLSTAGSVVNSARKIVNGTLSSAGSLIMRTTKSAAGAVAPDGGVIKRTATALTGSVTSSGTVTTIKTMLLELSGTLSLAGETVRQTSKGLAGTLAPEGSIAKLVAVAVSGALTSAGALVATIPGAAGGIIQSLFKGIRRALPRGFYKE